VRQVVLGLLVGATFGSHAGVALTRWTAQGSVREPARSRCDACGTAILARDLVPVVSWLMLRGRCRRCSAAIDRRLPVIEAACAVLGGLAAWVLVSPVRVAVGILAGSALVLATATDLERRIIPDRLTVPFAIVVVPLALHHALLDARAEGIDAVGALVSVLVPVVGVPVVSIAINALSVRTHGTRAIGGGDVKLLVGLTAAITLVPGGLSIFWVAIAVVGGGLALVGLLTGRLRPGDRVPFAPFLLAAYLAVLLVPMATRIAEGPA
jgi:leader peptidase (prepilin peptidase) / N-methyltransferase